MDELPSSRVELKNKSDYKLKIASNTLWKCLLIVHQERWKKNATLRFFTLWPIMCKNLATYSSNIDRIASFTNPLPLATNIS